VLKSVSTTEETLPRHASLELKGQTWRGSYLRSCCEGFWDELDKRGVSRLDLERTSGVTLPRSDDKVSTVSESALHRLARAIELAMRASPHLGSREGFATSAQRAAVHAITGERAHIATSHATAAAPVSLVEPPIAEGIPFVGRRGGDAA
jgi:hypothetical protein